MINLSGRRILIVEDEMLIALLMQDFLETLGCVVIGVAVDEAEASHLIETNRAGVDAVTLDVRLGETTSHGIAAMLDACGIPFIVTTGYDDAEHLAGLEDRPMIVKPYQQNDVAQALRLLKWRDVKDAEPRNCLGQSGVRTAGR
jgi:DNA-binding response OmpR family regulator